MSDATPVLHAVMREVNAGRRAALCVVVGTQGSTPQAPGAMICVDEAAQIAGTIGGGCVEAEVRRQAHEMITAAADTASMSVPSAALVTMDLDDDFGFDDGLICGGHMNVAVCVYSDHKQTDPLREALDLLNAGHPAMVSIRVAKADATIEYRINLESAPKVVIAGAGHVGKALAHLMVPLGFRVSVIDDRADFANPQRFPAPMEAVVGDINKTLADWPIDANTYVVIVTRGHKHDERALLAVIDSPAKYIGMIGSRRKIAIIFDDLMHEGIAKEKLDQVHAPIGIAIRCITPDEIALSIAAELVSVRREKYRRIVEGPIEV